MPDDGHVRVEYPNPPIEEALVQFTYAEPISWNVATPGLLFERLRSAYPEDPEAQEQIQASFEGPAGPSTPANLSVNRGDPRYIYRDRTRRRLLVCNQHMLSANSLRPYESWPRLRERIAEAVDTVGPVVATPRVTRVSLRYINRIVVEQLQVNTDDYFKVGIHTVNGGSAMLGGFIHRVQSIIDDNTIAISTFASVETERPELSAHGFLLDLDFQRNLPEPTEISDALTHADELKELENREFEDCITDATRELFQ